MRANQLLGDLLARVSDIGRSLIPVEDLEVTLGDRCETLLSGEGEATGLALAREILDRYQQLSGADKRLFFVEMRQRFGVEAARLSRSIQAWMKNNDYNSARQIHFASEPRSLELIRRLNRAPGATQDLVSMRSDLLLAITTSPELKQLDADFRHLFSSWFNRGFLELRRIDWNNTPALILEKIITYEAVHEINGWEELRLRVAAEDRRLYGFFHRALGAEPLIFVEVAMTRKMPGAIAPILTAQREMLQPDQASTAVFYSISNCQKGLRGISFGSFLIKQVVEELRHELPNLTTFVTLSPIPGMRQWAQQQLVRNGQSGLPDKIYNTISRLNDEAHSASDNDQGLRELAAYYLLEVKRDDGSPLDTVARFHLGNGACLEQINSLADTSLHGRKNSWGVMVNYLYDLSSIERNHEAFANQQKIICSSAVRRLLK